MSADSLSKMGKPVAQWRDVTFVIGKLVGEVSTMQTKSESPNISNKECYQTTVVS